MMGVVCAGSGSRLQKYWFIVRDKERDEKMILTRVGYMLILSHAYTCTCTCTGSSS